MSKKHFKVRAEIVRQRDGKAFDVIARGPRCKADPKKDLVDLPEGVCGVMRVENTPTGPQVKDVAAYTERGINAFLFRNANLATCGLNQQPLTAEGPSIALGRGFWEGAHRALPEGVDKERIKAGPSGVRFKLKCPRGITAPEVVEVEDLPRYLYDVPPGAYPRTGPVPPSVLRAMQQRQQAAEARRQEPPMPPQVVEDLSTEATPVEVAAAAEVAAKPAGPGVTIRRALPEQVKRVRRKAGEAEQAFELRKQGLTEPVSVPSRVAEQEPALEPLPEAGAMGPPISLFGLSGLAGGKGSGKKAEPIITRVVYRKPDGRTYEVSAHSAPDTFTSEPIGYRMHRPGGDKAGFLYVIGSASQPDPALLKAVRALVERQFTARIEEDFKMFWREKMRWERGERTDDRALVLRRLSAHLADFFFARDSQGRPPAWLDGTRRRLIGSFPNKVTLDKFGEELQASLSPEVYQKIRAADTEKYVDDAVQELVMEQAQEREHIRPEYVTGTDELNAPWTESTNVQSYTDPQSAEYKAARRAERAAEASTEEERQKLLARAEKYARTGEAEEKRSRTFGTAKQLLAKVRPLTQEEQAFQSTLAHYKASIQEWSSDFPDSPVLKGRKAVPIAEAHLASSALGKDRLDPNDPRQKAFLRHQVVAMKVALAALGAKLYKVPMTPEALNAYAAKVSNGEFTQAPALITKREE